MDLVFVSYAHTDEAFVLKLVDELRQNHVPLWFDGMIPTGQRWDNFIQKKLVEATVLLFVMSEASSASENVLDEVSFGLNNDKQVVPIRIDDCFEPYRVSRIQTIDFRANYAAAFKKLLKALPRQPAEPPTVPATRRQGHYAFWESLLERARQRTTLHLSISPQSSAAVAATAGLTGLTFRYALHRRGASVLLNIGTRDKMKNKAIFDTLAQSKAAIEAAFGETLTWERLDGYKSSHIKCPLDVDYKDEAQWPAIQDTMIDAMIRLEKALRPHLDALP